MMRIRHLKIVGAAVVCYVASSVSFAQNTAPIKYLGLTSAPVGPVFAMATGNVVEPAPRTSPLHVRSVGRASVSLAVAAPSIAASVPKPTPRRIVAPERGFVGFPGITLYQERFSGTGAYANTNFEYSPPDQGLCVGAGYVVEAVNAALAVYDTSGTLLSGPTSLQQFFNLAPQFVRPNGLSGPYITDPRCHFDADTGRWFVTMLEIDVDPVSGNLLNNSSLLVAVSTTINPGGSFHLYSIDTTDVDHPNCSGGCLGDQPLIGADGDGFYIVTNEYPIATIFSSNTSNGAQLYAMSKRALTAGQLPTVVHIDVGDTIPVPPSDAGANIAWSSLEPANAAAGSENDSGTMHFMSALNFGPAAFDNRIAVWALTGTQSLRAHNPALKLQHVILGTESYGVASGYPNGVQGIFAATQKPGPTPDRDSIGAGDPLESLNADDTRMLQVTSAGGKLYGALNTNVSVGAQTLVGAAYFVVSPSLVDGVLSARMVRQGYVAVANDNVLYPAVGVTADGTAAMVFTLVGPDYFPSAAYLPLNSPAAPIRLAAAGVGPQDDFTGYLSYGGNGVARWGDYSAAVADYDGHIWIATEYIGQSCTDAQYNADPSCGGTRWFNANWATFVGRIPIDSLR